MICRAAAFHESRHLDNSQLLPADPSCPFCGFEKRALIHILQEDPHVSLLKCLRCKASSASPLPTAEALDSYYRDYYKPSGSDERVTFDDTGRFGVHIARRFMKYLDRPSIKILDYGGGDGSVSVRTAEYLIQKGFGKINITVVDYNETLAEIEDKRISLKHYDKIDNLLSHDYDLVIASAVIEHIPQPRDIIIRLINLMNKGGLLYIRTPYVVPLMDFCKLFGIRWDFTFPAHIHDLGQDFWEDFFRSEFPAEHLSVVESRPSIVETSFSRHLLRTLAAYVLKMPWYLLGRHYKLVGGWEVFVLKRGEDLTEM